MTRKFNEIALAHKLSEIEPEISADVVHTTNDQAQRDQSASAHPTVQAYGPLIVAYDHFNRELFGGMLPACIITLQRNAERVLGYFHGDRFGHRERSNLTVDEIAMNPRHFRRRSIEETLSTLAHEMVHLRQHHDPEGKPSRVGYHNKQWSQWMQDIGLRPTHDGTPEGRLHGQRMTHIIVAGGAFDIACRKLLSDQFRIAWYDRLTEMSRVSEGGAENPGSLPAPSAGKRTKFTCPQCGSNAWGKPSLNLICGDCRVKYEA
ncbi:MAG TPA: SprT-like domain-containing protein [Hyphomicrobiaceae bacterium]|nr:SprT-like domain-containing protein [Hyphomicrobiaceae bacterium]